MSTTMYLKLLNSQWSRIELFHASAHTVFCGIFHLYIHLPQLCFIQYYEKCGISCFVRWNESGNSGLRKRCSRLSHTPYIYGCFSNETQISFFIKVCLRKLLDKLSLTYARSIQYLRHIVSCVTQLIMMYSICLYSTVYVLFVIIC